MSQKLLSIPTYSKLKAKNQDSEKNKKNVTFEVCKKKDKDSKKLCSPSYEGKSLN